MALKKVLEALKKAKALTEEVSAREEDLFDERAIDEVLTLGKSLITRARVLGPESEEYMQDLSSHLVTAFVLGYEKCERDNAEGGAKCQRC